MNSIYWILFVVVWVVCMSSNYHYRYMWLQDDTLEKSLWEQNCERKSELTRICQQIISIDKLCFDSFFSSLTTVHSCDTQIHRHWYYGLLFSIWIIYHSRNYISTVLLVDICKGSIFLQSFCTDHHSMCCIKIKIILQYFVLVL